ncbi:unnamed protein product [Sordaria macrospora k-hell]|uniref:Translation initiation factor eIF2B subunit delta n=1 Tax=Sordaria macrospora (strain ATCC MYA-333 / DSM 997 / K(L3346) / K-hell) TaxID=771870 RepID=F7W6W9_SORMK|nr:uncharacterized protein SMAC_07037 [Sordaria macrospora k-hell]CCC13259.1 unnamed protein product [Sordaria macrospora k-hell]
MATEATGAPAEAPAPQEKGKQQAKPAAAKDTPTTGGDAAGEQKLTPAQLKARAKAEKAARRAKAKEVKEAPPAAAAADAKGGKGSKGGKQEGGQSGSQQRATHVPMAKRIQTSQAHKDVHPAVLAVGQQMATFALKDSIARLEATLLAFKKVIESYETPKGNSLSRHFVPHVLNPQIEYLTECRPMSFSMGNAIRFLKSQVNKFDIDTPEDEAKESLLEFIDIFINERITLAEVVISKNAAELIDEDGVVLTYGRHRLVEKTILRAKSNGKNFAVSIIDDPYDQGGKELAKTLQQAGIPVFYSPNLGGLRVHLERASNVLLGTEAIFANGSLLAPAGTADVAMAASAANVKVVALCETINFDRERVSVDSLTYNEIDPERCSAESFRLMFDTTHSKYITGVITEFESGTDFAPAQAILTLLRKREDPTIA